MLIVDKLGLQTFFAILGNRKTAIRVIFPNSRASRLILNILAKIGFDIAEFHFSACEVERRAAPRFHIRAFKAECDLSERVSHDLVTRFPDVKCLNELNDRNSVRLHLAKVIQMKTGYVSCTIRIALIVDALGIEITDCSWPNRRGAAVSIQQFLSCANAPLSRCISAEVADIDDTSTFQTLLKRTLLTIVSWRFDWKPPSSEQNQIVVLSPEEDIFEDEPHLRQQYNWLTNVGNNIHAYRLNTSQFWNTNVKFGRDGRTSDLPRCVLAQALRREHHSPETRSIRAKFWPLVRRAFATSDCEEVFALIEALRLLLAAEEIVALVGT